MGRGALDKVSSLEKKDLQLARLQNEIFFFFFFHFSLRYGVIAFL